MSNFWDTYVKRRYQAHKTLLAILARMSITATTLNGLLSDEDYLKIAWFFPNNFDQFRVNWQDTSLPGEHYDIIVTPAGNKRAYLKRDQVKLVLPFKTYTLMISFVSPLSGKNADAHKKVTESRLKEDFWPYIFGEDDGTDKEQVIQNYEAILLTDNILDSSARKSIAEKNLLLTRGIRHFTTMAELQFDAVLHISQPKSVTKLTEAEIQKWIDGQKGLRIGKRVLGKDFDENRDLLETESDKIEYDDRINKQILSKLPTINSDDVLVKWYGFKTGDVLKIIRRKSMSRIVYRQVIFNVNELK